MGKKFEKYKITVKYLNGDIEDINLVGINTSDYQNMLKVYHRIKSTYADKVKTIDFVGIKHDGSMEIKWTKEIKPKGQEELREDIYDIMNNISNKIQLIKNKNFYHFDLINALNKKEDVKLHELEGLEKIQYMSDTDREKEILRIGKELYDIRLERRWHKNQFAVIQKLNENKIGDKEINLTHLSNVFRVKCNLNQIKPLNMKIAEELKIYKEEPIKDKEKQIVKLSKNFERVIVDPVENKFICYNKAKAI